MYKKTPDGVLEVVDCKVSSSPLSHPVKDGQMVEVAGRQHYFISRYYSITNEFKPFSVKA